MKLDQSNHKQIFKSYLFFVFTSFLLSLSSDLSGFKFSFVIGDVILSFKFQQKRLKFLSKQLYNSKLFVIIPEKNRMFTFTLIKFFIKGMFFSGQEY